MRPEDYDVIAKIIAQKVKAVADKLDSGLSERVAALEAENKALTDLLDDVVTGDQLRAVTDNLGVVAAKSDSLLEGLAELGDRVDGELEAVERHGIELASRLDEAEQMRANNLVTMTEHNVTVDERLATITGTVKAVSKSVDELIGKVAKTDETCATIREGIGHTRTKGTIFECIEGLEDRISTSDSSTDEMLNGLSDSIKHLRAQDEARAVETDNLEKRLDDTHSKRVALVNRVTALEDAESVDVADMIDRHWDEVGKNEVAAMLPDDWQEPLGRLENQVRNIELTPGPAGEVDMNEVGKMVGETVDNQLPVLIEATIDADPDRFKGMDGKPVTKEDVFIALDEYELDERLMPAIEGAVFRAMPDPVEPTELQVRDAVKALWPDIKAATLKYLPHMQHKGVYKPDEQYDIGDEVIKNGASFRLMHPTDEVPPGAGWQMIAQSKKGDKGKPGESIKGDKGDSIKGDPGVGINDIIMADGKLLAFELTDGTVKDFDLTEFIELIIKAIGEQ